MFQTDFVCVVQPNSRTGKTIIHFSENAGIKDGVLSTAELQRQNKLSFSRKLRDLIFFRLAHNVEVEDQLCANGTCVAIRVDPNNTKVVASDLREIIYDEEEIRRYAINMNDYLRIINENDLKESQDRANGKFGIASYDLRTFEYLGLVIYDEKILNKFTTTAPISRRNEILLDINKVPKEWFVYAQDYN